ncbi:hypothetical protein ACFOZ7_21285 [Natribaculum luteum]|uniref:DUF7260 domain-containing protein n=1 Tax=Natribaculum luteum TaxID=1586232 RepID=A0ABD5P523_9EURY|nr:hypothetical protein [Natribaculum luteum]
MTVTTTVDRALERVRTERDAVQDKRAALERFVARVEDVSVDPTPPPTRASTTAGGGTLAARSSPTDGGRHEVRTAFAETVRSHSVDDLDDDESLLETIASELSDSIATALGSTPDGAFTPDLKRAVLSSTRDRVDETQVVAAALDREATHLADVRDEIATITDWLVDADDTPLSECEFDELATRHDRLAAHRERCDRLVRDRQAHLAETTNQTAKGAVAHRTLVTYLYDDFPVDYPVLATVVRLDAVCADCQRAVRDHLVRRA